MGLEGAMQFEFATATRILFGRGKLKEAARVAASIGRRALVVTGKAAARASALVETLGAEGVDSTTRVVSGEPSIDSVADGARAARDSGRDLVIGIGGGSVIDAAKAIAALLTNDGDLLDYLEVIGSGRPLSRPAAPFIAIPTTAGTGSEVTRNAVLASPEHRVKVSLRSPFMLPRVAVVDPELTLSVPADVTASTGLDALTQLIEPYVCNSPNPLTDAVCREGMHRAARHLKRACEEGSDIRAREAMSVASLFGGIALANAKLGAVHGLAAPLGGMFPAPHGAVCARLLPLVMRVNLEALAARAPGSDALQRYSDVARILTGNPSASAEDGVRWVELLCADLSIAPLSNFGLRREDFVVVAARAAKASSMKGNPVELTREEIIAVLAQSVLPCSQAGG
jgi:alcohol dehydrogenase class IV